MKKIYLSLIASLAFGLAPTHAMANSEIADADDTFDSTELMFFYYKDGRYKYAWSTNLEITFRNDKLIASGPENYLEIPLSELDYFHFNGRITGIELPEELKSGFTVYNLSGVSLGYFDNFSEARKALPEGIYVIEKDSSTYKAVIK